jgi:hypothetical protein
MRGTANLAIALITASTAACSSAQNPGDDVNGEAPLLEVLTPERGTTADATEVTVTGRATDDEPGLVVTVNGVETTTAADGSFSAVVPVTAGLSLIETHAIDARANDVRDVRAVLAGTLLPTDGSIGAPIAARVGAGGLAQVGNVLAATAQALDWNALALGMNPLSEDDGCNAIHRLDAEQLTVGTIGVSIVPGNGALQLVVTINDIYLRMHAEFEAICIDGSTTVEVTSSQARITGDLVIGVAGGVLVATLPASSVTLDGFGLNIGGVPGAIEDLIEGEARDAAEDALADAVRDQVPAEASEALAGLLAQPIATDILERPTTFTMTPDGVMITPEGLVASVDTRVLVTGGEGGVFASSPMPLTSGVWASDQLGLALADDVLNQLFGGLWASGALTPNLSLDGDAGILAPLLDDDARAIKLTMLLPPYVRAEGGVLELAIGDILFSVRDEADTEIQQFALSIVTSLAAMPNSSGGLAVTVGTPTVRAQLVMQTDAVDTQLTGEQLEGIVTGAWGLIGNLLGESLQDVPMPSVSGLQLGGPSLSGRDGFLVVDVPLQ